MNCKFEGHKNSKLTSICFQDDCKEKSRVMCNFCIRNLHAKCSKDFVIIEEIFDEEFTLYPSYLGNLINQTVQIKENINLEEFVTKFMDEQISKMQENLQIFKKQLLVQVRKIQQDQLNLQQQITKFDQKLKLQDLIEKLFETNNDSIIEQIKQFVDKFQMDIKQEEIQEVNDIKEKLVMIQNKEQQFVQIKDSLSKDLGFLEKLNDKYLKDFSQQSNLSIDSNILDNKNDLSQICEWFKQNNKIIKKLEKVFQCGPNEQFKASKYHQFCDGKQNLIFFLLTETQEKVGGFTSNLISSNIQWQPTELNFIFNLDNKKMLIYDKNMGNYAFLNHPDLGPLFAGSPGALQIEDDNKAYSYTDVVYKYFTNSENQRIVKKESFKFHRFEAFQVFYA